jgi:hypothetical protein
MQLKKKTIQSVIVAICLSIMVFILLDKYLNSDYKYYLKNKKEISENQYRAYLSMDAIYIKRLAKSSYDNYDNIDDLSTPYKRKQFNVTVLIFSIVFGIATFGLMNNQSEK